MVFVYKTLPAIVGTVILSVGVHPGDQFDEFLLREFHAVVSFPNDGDELAGMGAYRERMTEPLQEALMVYLAQFPEMTNGDMMDRISGFTISQLLHQIDQKGGTMREKKHPGSHKGGKKGKK